MTSLVICNQNLFYEYFSFHSNWTSMCWGLVKSYKVGLHISGYKIIRSKIHRWKIRNDLTHSYLTVLQLKLYCLVYLNLGLRPNFPPFSLFKTCTLRVLEVVRSTSGHAALAQRSSDNGKTHGNFYVEVVGHCSLVNLRKKLHAWLENLKIWWLLINKFHV